MILRKAHNFELPVIWNILQEAIEQRRQDGSQQWQDGYPNEQSIQEDMDQGYAYVLAEEDQVLAYVAVIFDKEPAYDYIEGKWLTDGDYLVVHRVAVSNKVKGKGVATSMFKLLERVCLERNIYSIKVDTNFDNMPMLRILDKLGYTYCGEVYIRGGARRAYEKVLAPATE